MGVDKTGEPRRVGLFQILRTVPPRKVNVFSAKDMHWWNSGTPGGQSYDR
jgi:hypothetical protein